MKQFLHIIWLYPLFSFSGLPSTLNEYIFPDFDAAMYSTDIYKSAYQNILKNPAELPFIQQAQETYNSFIMKYTWQESPRIPKIIHQIWVGPNALPKNFRDWQKTWLEAHPDWEYKLWTDKDVAEFPLINQKYYNATQSYGEKANILRYEILNRFGGVYIDTDFECIKPLDFLHHTCDFYVGFEFPQSNKDFLIIGNAIIGAQPGHPFLKLFIHKMKEYWHHTWQPKRSGTFFVTDIIKRNVAHIKGINVLFPANFFYPWSDNKKPWEKNDSNTYQKLIPPESIGFHHWDLSWQKKRCYRWHTMKSW